MHDWRETEALWRYGVIRDAVDERLTHRQRGPIVRELAAGMHEHPGGQRRELSRSASTGGYAHTWPAGLTR
jgi:hypothetical protein